MPTIKIPPAYRGPTGGLAEVDVPEGSVRAGLDAAEARHPGLRDQVIDATGAPHRFVKLFRNGEPLDEDPLDAALGTSDELEIVAAIGGG